MLKKVVFLFLFLFCYSLVFADVWVNGYTKKDGTKVDGHWRSDPDGNFYNNWSTYGNTNPYTGEAGTKTDNPNSSYSYLNYSFMNTTNRTTSSSVNNYDNWESSLEEAKKKTLEQTITSYIKLAEKEVYSKDDRKRLSALRQTIISNGGKARLEQIDKEVHEQREKNRSDSDTTDSNASIFIFLIVAGILVFYICVMAYIKEKEK